MSLNTVLDALETLLEGVSGFDSTMVIQLDRKILSSGKGPKYIVIAPVSLLNQEDTFTRTEVTYEIDLEVYFRYNNIASVDTAIVTDMQNIVNRIDLYPKLNGTAGVFDAIVESAELPLMDEPPVVRRGGNRYAKLTARVRVREQVSLSRLE